jgi:hypothetical protein
VYGLAHKPISKDHLAHKVLLAHKDLQGFKAHRERRVQRVVKGFRALLE